MIPRLPNNMRRPRGFTLIELLAVIAIIGILSAMTLGLYGFVKTSRLEARARSEIALLSTKLEEFKGRYGEFPMAESASEAEWEKALFNALSGRWSYKKVDGKISWDKTREGVESDKLRPFVESGLVGTDADIDEGKTATKFVDPWGNAYRYRYGKINASTGRPDSQWERAGVFLISKGAKFKKPDSEGDETSDSFSGEMETTGIVDSAYFDDEYRADNLTNFGAK